MERWLSGLKRVPGKDVSGQPDREFESLPLRQEHLVSDVCECLIGCEALRMVEKNMHKKSEHYARIFCAKNYCSMVTIPLVILIFDLKLPMSSRFSSFDPSFRVYLT